MAALRQHTTPGWWVPPLPPDKPTPLHALLRSSPPTRSRDSSPQGDIDESEEEGSSGSDTDEGVEGEEGPEGGSSGEEEDEEAAAARHAAMLEAVTTSGGAAAARKRRKAREVVVTEAYPESAYNLPAAGELAAELAARVGGLVGVNLVPPSGDASHNALLPLRACTCCPCLHACMCLHQHAEYFSRPERRGGARTAAAGCGCRADELRRVNPTLRIQAAADPQ